MQPLLVLGEERGCCRGGSNKEVETFSVGTRIVAWGSDTHKPICICVCARFSGRVHTEMGEGQILDLQRKRLSANARTNTHSKKFVRL